MFVDFVVQPDRKSSFAIIKTGQHFWWVERLEAAVWSCYGAGGEAAAKGSLAFKPGKIAYGHGFVVTCPLAPGQTHQRLDAVLDNKVVWTSGNVELCMEELFSNKVDYAACTMIIARSSVITTLKAWVEHHVLLGLQQILLYVQEKDDAFVQETIPEYLSRGQVKVINFRFPGLNDKFQMQRAQLNHCLYWGRGRVKWMAQMDVDEFFQPVVHRTLPQFLSHVNRAQRDLVSVQSAVWVSDQDFGKAAQSPSWPCSVIHKGHEFQHGVRSKMIINVDAAMWVSIHKKLLGSHPDYKANPNKELRLVHARPDTFQGAGVDGKAIKMAFRDSYICKLRRSRDFTVR